jgi:hypothetical protein
MTFLRRVFPGFKCTLGRNWLLFFLSVAGVVLAPLLAEASPITGNGTANYVPKFSDPVTVTNSHIYETGGNVGIGLSTPSDILHLYTNATNDGLRVQQFGTTASALRLTSASRDWALFATGTGNSQGGGHFVIHDYTSGSDRFFIRGDNGAIGIGTDSPVARLHVETSDLTGIWLNHSSSVDWAYALAVNVNRDRTKAFTINSSVTGANLFTIWGNGMVDAKKIYAEEIQVRPDAMSIYWPDDVFSPAYHLRPLGAVVGFYKMHKHLPDVPSAKDVADHGIDVARMNATLLRKVEELTIYVARQQQEIDQLRKQVNKRGG